MSRFRGQIAWISTLILTQVVMVRWAKTKVEKKSDDDETGSRL